MHDCDVFDLAHDLARTLVFEGYPLEIIDGLQVMAAALIDAPGFEPYFRECVARAREHMRACLDGYNLPAVVV